MLPSIRRRIGRCLPHANRDPARPNADHTAKALLEQRQQSSREADALAAERVLHRHPGPDGADAVPIDTVGGDQRDSVADTLIHVHLTFGTPGQ